MRENVRAFVRLAAECFQPRGPVFEFGAYQVEGQAGQGDLRDFFPGRKYLGCDMRPGPGVDQIEDLAALTMPDASAATIICVDTLEHVFEVRKAADEMLRVLAPGGLLLVSAPMDFRIHDYPSDYWRITPSCLERLLAPLDATLVGWQGVDSHPHTVYAIGAKAPLDPQFARQSQQFIAGFQKCLGTAEARRTPSFRWKRRLFGWLRSKGERRRVDNEHQARFVMHCRTSNVAESSRPPGSVTVSVGTRIDALDS